MDINIFICINYKKVKEIFITFPNAWLIINALKGWLNQESIVSKSLNQFNKIVFRVPLI